jgi:hypothetical protein
MMLAAAAVAALGCYDRSTVITSGPPPDAELRQLTEPQAAQLCKSLELRARARADAKTVTHASCLLMAGIATEFAQTNDPDFDPRSTCQSIYKACLAKDAKAADENLQCSTRRFAGCSASVETYRACQERSLDALGDALGSRTCDDLIATPDAGPPPNPFDNPACDELYARCPKLIDVPQGPECSASIRTTGAIRADLMLPSDNCYSQVSRTGAVDWISLSVWSSAHLALQGVELTLPVHVAPWSERLDSIGLSVRNDSSINWQTDDGCEGDVEVESCEVDGASGDRYRVRNGRCALPLSADDVEASELTVAEFSFWSYCIRH